MSYRLPKILIAIPTYEGKNYCLDAFLTNILNFSYPKSKLDYYIADNSKTNANAKYINKTYGLKVFWKDYDTTPIFEKMADSHNQLRRYFLDSDCEYMLHLESDVFPPPDVLEQLLWARKPIVNSLYQVFDGSWRTPCIALNDVKNEHHREFVFHTTLDNFWHWYIDGKIKKTFIAGIGCSLMKRKVLDNFPFRHDANETKPPDTWFAEDLRRSGVQNWVHTGVLSFHYNREDWGRHFEYVDYHKSE